MNWTVHFLTALIFSICVSCIRQSVSNTGPDPLVVRQIPAELKADASNLVASNTVFAIDLYKSLPLGEGNAVTSPHSISTALAMTWAGAKGKTASQMATTLHFDQDPARIHVLFSALQKSLDTGGDFHSYSLRIANRLWGSRDRAWVPAFLAITKEQYGAELQPMDFAASPEAARQTINQWVLTRTDGAIPDLMAAGSIQADTKLVLANAIAFKGLWAQRFNPESTKMGSFHVDSGNTVQAPFMNLSAHLEFDQQSGVSVVELPFRGGDLAMVFLLPSPGSSLKDLESNLSPANLALWTGHLQKGLVALSLPRFSFTSSYDLEKVLPVLGMSDAFNELAADFSGMDGLRDLYVRTLTHKVRVEVNEDGAAASAGTAVNIAPSAPRDFTFDRPFLFILLDKVTGALLFIGRVTDPSQGN